MGGDPLHPEPHDLSALVHETAPRVRAALVRRHGQVDLAEDAVADALLAAATQWPTDGVPDDPGAWLMTVAQRRLVDQVRSQHVTLEIDPHHAAVARECVDDAGVGDRVEIVIGPGLETLPTLDGPFDLVFVDADKENNAGYVRAALDLPSPGALVIVDNVVRDGRVADPSDDSPMIRGVREVVDSSPLSPGSRRSSPCRPWGSKGWDGFLVARHRPS